jgi:hypothetical protein
MNLDVKMMHGIPDAEVEKTVNTLKADPKYVSHEVIPEGGGKNTIEVNVRVD